MKAKTLTAIFNITEEFADAYYENPTDELFGEVVSKFYEALNIIKDEKSGMADQARSILNNKLNELWAHNYHGIDNTVKH